jgi:hypothetical protein
VSKVSVVVLLYKCQYRRTGWCEQSVGGGFTVQMSVQLTAITHRHSDSHTAHIQYKYTLHSQQLNCTYSNYTQTQCQSRSTFTVKIHTVQSAI